MKINILFIMLVLILGCIRCSTTSKLFLGKQTSQILEQEIIKKIKLQYLLYLPDDYNQDDKKWPLMLFLHGAGERGNNLENVKFHGPPKLIENGQKFPFVIISPQCSEGHWWSAEVEVLDLLLEEITSNYNIDMDRMYITGLSMGGYGTWALACEFPQRFAAIAPICGGGDPDKVEKIKHLPTWVFHGAKDETVPIERPQEMVDALKKIDGNVKFTVYPEATHDSWTETYNNPELYRWLLSHTRK